MGGLLLEINLLPRKIFVTRCGKRRLVWVAVILLIVTIVSPLFASIGVDSYYNRPDMNPTSAEHNLVRGISSQVNLLSRDINRLEQQEQSTARYKRLRDEPVAILSMLARDLPTDITLSAISYSSKETVLFGVARNQDSLKRLFRILLECEVYGPPNIRKTSWKRIDELRVLEFEVAMLRDRVKG